MATVRIPGPGDIVEYVVWNYAESVSSVLYFEKKITTRKTFFTFNKYYFLIKIICALPWGQSDVFSIANKFSTFDYLFLNNKKYLLSESELAKFYYE